MGRIGTGVELTFGARVHKFYLFRKFFSNVYYLKLILLSFFMFICSTRNV